MAVDPLCTCAFEVWFFAQSITASLMRDQAAKGWRLESLEYLATFSGGQRPGSAMTPEIIWRQPCRKPTCPYVD